MSRKHVFFTLILLFMFLTQALIAQTTGKIIGQVKDKATKQPIAGANVIVLGTQRGASSDLNGDFVILNMPPGLYDIEIQMIGYKKLKLEGIQVSVNRTAYINAELEEAVLEGEVVVVTADRVSIKKDQTSSIRNITSDDIQALPVDNINQIVNMQPGVVGSHFRGGRSNEVNYMVDGILVSESFYHEDQTVQVNPDAVEEVEVITGTFNAEYGAAMSGVVNVITKEGSNKFRVSGSIHGGNYLTSHTDKFIGLEATDFNRIGDYSLNLSGPIFSEKLSYITDFRYYYDDGHLNGIRRFKVDDYSDFSHYPDEWISEANGDSAYVPMDTEKRISFLGKLTFKPTSSFKTSLIYTLNNNESQSYNHQYRFAPDGRPTYHEQSNMVAIKINHMLSNKAFYEFKVAYNRYKTGSYVFENPLDSRYVHDFYHRITGQWFFTGGQDKNHTRRLEQKYDVKFDLMFQLNKNHSIKTGFEYIKINLDQKYANIRNKYEGTDLESVYEVDSLTNKIRYLYYEPEVRPNNTVYSDFYKKKPLQFAAYIQDKMEFESMVVNLGLRLDYFDPKTVYPTNWRNPANQDYFEDKSRMSEYKKVKPQYQLSPRLGLSYQLGKSALIRFSYGHFLQIPPLNYFYQNNTFIVTELGMVGNPLLKAQKTVQYEIGFWKQLTNSMNFEMAIFYRDIYNLLSSRLVYTYSQMRYGLFDNKDYGNARGLELKYQYQSNPWFFNLNYTLQYTRGVADSPYLAFNRQGQDMDPINKLIPLEWDQRHTLNFSVGYATKKWASTLLFFFNSGRPYTWSPISESPLALLNLLPNNQYRPAQFSVDLNAHYNLFKIKNVNVRLTLLAYNILDRLNEVWVNSTTGRAYTGIVRPVDLLTYRSNFSTYYDVLHNPSMFSMPRQIKVGLEFQMGAN